MKTENGIIEESEFVESIVEQMKEDELNEGYFDKMGDLEPYRNCFPEAKQGISKVLVKFMNNIQASGVDTRDQVIAEARSILHQIDTDLANGRFG